jgi:hypothetical protein
MTICPLDAEYALKPEEIVNDLPFFEVALDDTQPMVLPDFARDTLTRIGKREVSRVINYTRQQTIKQVLAQGPRRPVTTIPYMPPAMNFIGHGYREVPDKVLKARRVDEQTIQIPQVVVEKDREDEIDRLIAIWNDQPVKKKHFKRLRKFGSMVGLAITIALKEGKDGS